MFTRFTCTRNVYICDYNATIHQENMEVKYQRNANLKRQDNFNSSKFDMLLKLPFSANNFQNIAEVHTELIF